MLNSTAQKGVNNRPIFRYGISCVFLIKLRCGFFFCRLKCSFSEIKLNQLKI